MKAGDAGRDPVRLFFLVTEDWYFVSHRLPLAVAARNAGYDVTVVTRVRDHAGVIQDAGLRLIPFEMSRSGINPVGEVRTIARLVSLYRRERPDIVHQVAMKPVIYGSIAARIAGTSGRINALAGMGWLFASDSGPARMMRPIVRRVLAVLLREGIVLVQNPDDARLLVQVGIREDRIRRIAGSGVDLQRFRPGPECPGVPVIVLAARLIWDKGVGEFVTAARILRERGMEARFILAGDPDPANPASIPAKQIADWVSEGIVEHTGWLKNMPELFAVSHVVCLPSNYREGIPKSLIEAAAAGRPIVTTDVPGCREVVRNGDNGLLVPPRDTEALADALARLIRDPALRRTMGARGRIRAEQEFGLDAVIEQTLELYDEVYG